MKKIMLLALSFLVACLNESEVNMNDSTPEAGPDAQVSFSPPADNHYDICESPQPINISLPPPVECDPFGKYLDYREDPESNMPNELDNSLPEKDFYK